MTIYYNDINVIVIFVKYIQKMLSSQNVWDNTGQWFMIHSD